MKSLQIVLKLQSCKNKKGQYQIVNPKPLFLSIICFSGRKGHVCCSKPLKTILWRGVALWVRDCATLLGSTTDVPCSRSGNPLVFPPKRNKQHHNTELCASVYIQDLCLVPPLNLLSNDMTQWVTIPLIQLRGGDFWQRSSWMQQKEEFGMNFRAADYWTGNSI